MIFLDTSFFVAVSLGSDQNYPRAINISKGIMTGKFGDAYTSEYVFDETITLLLAQTKNIFKVIRIGEAIIDGSRIISIGRATFADSWGIFKEQRITKFSFTDCTTIEIIKDNSIKNMATFDAEFKRVKGLNVIGALDEDYKNKA